MPEKDVSAPSVNCFKGRFDKYWTNLKYEIDAHLFTIEIANGRRKYLSVNRPFCLSFKTEEEDDDDDDDDDVDEYFYYDLSSIS